MRWHHPTVVSRRAAMTLVEMLVATAVTLIMMAAIAQLFGTLGQGVNGTRSLTEIDDRMRAVAFRLRSDLEGGTAPVYELPPLSPERNMGYFEIIEGPMTDRSILDVPYVDGSNDDRLRGDVDDALLLTTRATTALFSGRSGGQGIQSPLAEVIWYCRPTANTEDPALYTLYRRQRLVMAHPGTVPFIDPGSPNAVAFTTWADLHAVTDIACRIQEGFAIPNTLGDLTKRENRFCRDTEFPYRFLPDKIDTDGRPILTFDEAHPRYGEDVVLTNVIAFDVRVFDSAPVQTVGTYLIFPGDAGFDPAKAGGSFTVPVDLAWGNPGGNPVEIGEAFPPDGIRPFRTAGVTVRNGPPQNLLGVGSATYCTWSTHYEYNGIDDDGRDGIDQGTNGKDDNKNNLIDEQGEAETSPPYPVPLRGIEIRIRCYEPSSRQVRQVTIRHTLVPQ
jgi:hypothetical protein